MPKAGAIWPARLWASSVTMTKPMRELSSRSAKRSPAASLTQAIFVRVRSGVASAAVSAPPGALAQVDVDADDVRVTGGEGQDALAAAADDERWARALHGAGREGVTQHLVVLAVEVERPVGAQEALDDLDRFLEARHAHGRVVVGQPGLVVVGAHPAGAEAHFEAAVAQHVERGRLLGQHEGVAVVVAEDQRAHAQRRRGGRHRRQGRDGGELVPEVIGHEQGAVAEVLGFARLCGPRAGGAVRCLAQLRGEAELAVVCHPDMLPQIAARPSRRPRRRLGHTSTPPFCWGGPRALVKSGVAQAAPGRGRHDDHGLGVPPVQLGPDVGGQ